MESEDLRVGRSSQSNQVSSLGAGKPTEARMRHLPGVQTSQDRQKGGRKGSELALSLAVCSPPCWALQRWDRLGMGEG